jgi:tRNA threonylcarbamoyladenosine biosynthesis protein TsaE
MRALGREIGAELAAGDVVLLHGDLGAGKTTLTQGIAEALGIEGVTQSPTFTLMSEYPAMLADGTPTTLYHLDLYRLHDPEELGDIGWDEAIAPADGVTVVEWPERAGDWLPERYTLVSIRHADADTREVCITTAPA